MKRKLESEEEFLAALNKELESVGLPPATLGDADGDDIIAPDSNTYQIIFKNKADKDPFEQLVTLLHKLKDNYGWFIMRTKNHLYCQLRRNEDETLTRFEAVSHYYNETLDKRLETDFKSLGFRLAKKGNYQKKILLDSDAAINETAFEIMKIFQDIYKIYEEPGFEFDDQITIKK